MERGHVNRRPNSVSAERPRICYRHDCPLDAYCRTDDLVICAECERREHKGHTVGLVREERKMKQDELKKLKLRCQERLQQQEKVSNKTQALNQIQEKARETDDFCQAVLTEIIDLLQTHYVSLREVIRSKYNAAVESIQAQKQRATEVKKRCSELDRLAHADSDVTFLTDWPSLRQRCEKDLQHESLDELFLPFESIKNTVSGFGQQLKEFCNDGFASITNDVIATDQEMEEVTGDDNEQQTDEDSFDVYEVTSTEIQFAEPTTRDDFLQYACDLTLDPRTAHEDLILSPGLKEVRLAPPTARGPAVRCPERFLYRRQLLCREGLQGERCYYEIEVTGGKAEIALAYKSIDRKSSCSNRKSAFGGNTRSWSLDRSPKHYSVSHNNSSVGLTSVPRQKRIGVYLRFEEGTVSFFEVSDCDDMKFLYKLEADFTEPLYPGFWVDEKCCINICDLKFNVK